ncbi:MAG: DUF3275 family protein [Rhodocyclaceae bacterium]|nr:DUF3275 family protein [Rhodocyclaceae bacterium]
MTVSLNGSITIRIIPGRNGDFAVGELSTAIGDFKVKDTALDQFSAGTYSGHFIVEEIFLSSYTTRRGGLVTEMRARLSDLLIDDEHESQAERSDAEPDPADESSFGGTASAPEDSEVDGDDRETATADPVALSASAESPEATLMILFGDDLARAIETRSPVKLDATIERLRFREQRDRLKRDLSYGFVADDQTWYPREAEAYVSYLSRRSGRGGQ